MVRKPRRKTAKTPTARARFSRGRWRVRLGGREYHSPDRGEIKWISRQYGKKAVFPKKTMRKKR